MECNKDEATRAKSIAESKLEQKDYFGAKKFASKAQTLYPGLDGISQMLTTLDVYVAAENKIGGVVDWYIVLGVDPTADDETIKKQYRKLALMLHPDKNSSIGADGAFKLISEAWSFLSDKEKRTTYNKQRGYKGFQQNFQSHTGGPSAPSNPNHKVPTNAGAQSVPSRPSQQKVPLHTPPSKPHQQKVSASKSSSRKASVPKSQSRSAKRPSKPSPAHQRTDSFWTTCNQCNRMFEYLKMYVNCTLRCHHCHKPFLASETDPPPDKFLKSAKYLQPSSSGLAGQHAYDPGRNAAAKKPGVGQACQSSIRHGNNQSGTHPGTADIESKEPSIASKVAGEVQKVHDQLKRRDQLKRPHIESYTFSGEEGCFKKMKLGNERGSAAPGRSDFGTASASGSTSCGFNDAHHEPNSTKEKNGCNSNTQEHDVDEKHELSTSIGEGGKNHRDSPFADNARKEHPKEVTVQVPGSDFHNFDADRSERSFSDNEIWAVYDDDGMPRSYVLVSKVISRDPFELRIRWLDLITNSGCINKDRVGSIFYSPCGEFRANSFETCTAIKAFSHRTKWSESPDGSIIILPQKGDIWALYSNLRSDCSKNTPDGVVHKYHLVMITNDYSEEQGVSVASLVKVAGFRTLFLQNLSSAANQRIPKNELSRFSHQVPYHFLSREEAPNTPEGSMELDPAAIPAELLQKKTQTGRI